MSPPRVSVGFGLPSRPPLALTRWLVRWARLLRLDSLWVVDHFLGFVPRSIWDEDFTFLARQVRSPDVFFDYQTLLGYLARRAGRIRLCVGVTDSLRRHPIALAQAFMTLSHMVRVPPILGVGAGERENLEPYGISFRQPVSRLAEALQVIRLCFDSQGPFDFQGRFFRLDQAMMDLAPAAGRRPQLWVAAHGPRMLELTGRYGDGWYPVLPMTPDEYGGRLSDIHRAAVRAGRDPSSIVPGLNLPFVVASTEDRARALLDAPPVRFALLLLPDSLWREHGSVHPLGEGFEGMVDFVPQRYDRARVERAMASVPRSLIESRILWGTPDTIVRRVRELAEAGLRHVVLSGSFGLLSRRQLGWAFLATSRIAMRLRRGN